MEINFYVSMYFILLHLRTYFDTLTIEANFGRFHILEQVGWELLKIQFDYNEGIETLTLYGIQFIVSISEPTVTIEANDGRIQTLEFLPGTKQ